MIFGKTNEEKEVKRKKKYRKRFAWLPVEIAGGQKAWLCFIEESSFTRNVRIYNPKKCFESNENI